MLQRQREVWRAFRALDGDLEEPGPIAKGPRCVCGRPVAYRAYCPPPIGARERPVLACKQFGETLRVEYGARLEPIDGEPMLASQESHVLTLPAPADVTVDELDQERDQLIRDATVHALTSLQERL
jgi:hypothetical protein